MGGMGGMGGIGGCCTLDTLHSLHSHDLESDGESNCSPTAGCADHSSTVRMRVGFGSHIYTVPLKTDKHSLVKLRLSDCSGAVCGSQSLGEPISVAHFPTLENTAPEYLFQGSACRQSCLADTYALGLSYVHLLAGTDPYNEMMHEVHCPAYLSKKLGEIWYDRAADGDEAGDCFNVLRQVVRSYSSTEACTAGEVDYAGVGVHEDDDVYIDCAKNDQERVTDSRSGSGGIRGIGGIRGGAGLDIKFHTSSSSSSSSSYSPASTSHAPYSLNHDRSSIDDMNMRHAKTTLFDTLYRYMVLFGVSIAKDLKTEHYEGHDPLFLSNPVWHAVQEALGLYHDYFRNDRSGCPILDNGKKTTLQVKGGKGKKGSKAARDSKLYCMNQFREDLGLWSMHLGRHAKMHSCRSRLSALGPTALSLLESMVHLDPTRRVSMFEALHSPMFASLREVQSDSGMDSAMDSGIGDSGIGDRDSRDSMGTRRTDEDGHSAPLMFSTETHDTPSSLGSIRGPNESRAQGTQVSFMHYYRPDGKGMNSLPIV